MNKQTFNLYYNPLNTGTHAIEASAGTGKTYTLAQLVVRLVVEKGVLIDQILTVTFTRAAAAELRERVFDKLSEVLSVLEGEASKDADLQTWVRSLPDADAARGAILKARMMLDQAPIYTIDAFAMQVAREYALALGLPWDASLLEDDKRLKQQLVDRLWHQLASLSEEIKQAVLSVYASPDVLYERFNALGLYAEFETKPDFQSLVKKREDIQEKWPAERLQVLSAAIHEAVYENCKSNSKNTLEKSILTPLKEGEFPVLKENVTLVEYLKKVLLKRYPYENLPEKARQALALLDADLQSLPSQQEIANAWFIDVYQSWRDQFKKELDQKGVFSYDSLKNRLRIAVEAQPKLKAALQSTYQACLIDEFQDTDPDQWQLFHQLFGTDSHRLFLIGDPKQAIYGFRGANLLTYLNAVESANYHHTLTTNFRSHPDLVEGFNALFAERDSEHPTFIEPRCAYEPLKSAKSAQETAFVLDEQPYEKIRIVCGEASKEKGEVTLPQLARDVVRVLSQGKVSQKVEGEEGFSLREIKPGDIAILVKSNTDAQAVQGILRKVNVPSVLTSRTTVWQSDSARLLLLLIKVILDPRQRQGLRGVLVTPFFQYTLEQLQDEAVFNEAQLLFSETLQRWEQYGVLAALLTLFDKAGVWEKMASLPDGERRIADTRHLLELIHAESYHENMSPQAVLRWAEQQHSGATSSEQTLRLERDDDAVEIVTMHSSKGLEYPVVFVYGAWKEQGTSTQSFPIALPTVEGVKGSFSKDDKKVLQEQAQQELLRLFYVACTRAVSHLTIYWPDAYSEKTAESALKSILQPRLDDLKKHTAFIFDDYETQNLTSWTPKQTTVNLMPPKAVPFAQIQGRSMTLTSYSGLTRHSLSADSPFQRWLEEGEEVAAKETAIEALEESRIEQPPEDDLPAGASFGKLVHDFLEMTNFTEPDWKDLTRRWQSFAQDPKAVLPEALKSLVRQTLAGDCQPFRLADLSAQSTYKEHHFVLHAPKMDLSALNRWMSSRSDWQAVEPARVHGYLQGFIDLIAEVDGKYYILDYKTNRLQDYAPASLEGAMREHHYTLQALIYSLALDAHLRTFKKDYRPEVHLGGVRYLFMRGMRENSTDGVYVLNFDEETLKQARRALTGEEA